MVSIDCQFGRIYSHLGGKLLDKFVGRFVDCFNWVQKNSVNSGRHHSTGWGPDWMNGKDKVSLAPALLSLWLQTAGTK